ncbi:MAG TPA: ATP-NAD kinase family protein [Actinomycetota bacterium]|nr:ATP-NAD kinase family protein [Actinomycetota bacterium]
MAARDRPVRLGLVVNPIAGIGGRVGLKGSDGEDVVRRALALGAVPEASPRTVRALERLGTGTVGFELFVGPGPMGEDAARATGLDAHVVGELGSDRTTAEDTRRFAAAMAERGVDLLLFAGGDGTAADVLAAVGDAVPVLGVPAGVKIHSAAFAVSPEAAGSLAASVARDVAAGARPMLREAEVLDLDEDDYRSGRIAPRLVGYLRVPREPRLVQARKAPSPASEEVMTRAIAEDVVDGMEPGRAYVLGPGTTLRAVAERLGVPKTLVGVDVIRDGRLVETDANEDTLLAVLEQGPASVVVTPIGGQGFVFGRGNQQIGPRVLRAVGREHVVVVATPWKLASLAGRPLRVDTGDPPLDAQLAGHVLVTTGYGDRAVYRIEV